MQMEKIKQTTSTKHMFRDVECQNRRKHFENSAPQRGFTGHGLGNKLTRAGNKLTLTSQFYSINQQKQAITEARVPLRESPTNSCNDNVKILSYRSLASEYGNVNNKFRESSTSTQSICGRETANGVTGSQTSNNNNRENQVVCSTVSRNSLSSVSVDKFQPGPLVCDASFAIFGRRRTSRDQGCDKNTSISSDISVISAKSFDSSLKKLSKRLFFRKKIKRLKHEDSAADKSSVSGEAVYTISRYNCFEDLRSQTWNGDSNCLNTGGMLTEAGEIPMEGIDGKQCVMNGDKLNIDQNERRSNNTTPGTRKTPSPGRSAIPKMKRIKSDKDMSLNHDISMHKPSVGRPRELLSDTPISAISYQETFSPTCSAITAKSAGEKGNITRTQRPSRIEYHLDRERRDNTDEQGRWDNESVLSRSGSLIPTYSGNRHAHSQSETPVNKRNKEGRSPRQQTLVEESYVSNNNGSNNINGNLLSSQETSVCRNSIINFPCHSAVGGRTDNGAIIDSSSELPVASDSHVLIERGKSKLSSASASSSLPSRINVTSPQAYGETYYVTNSDSCDELLDTVPGSVRQGITCLVRRNATPRRINFAGDRQCTERDKNSRSNSSLYECISRPEQGSISCDKSRASNSSNNEEECVYTKCDSCAVKSSRLPRLVRNEGHTPYTLPAMGERPQSTNNIMCDLTGKRNREKLKQSSDQSNSKPSVINYNPQMKHVVSAHGSKTTGGIYEKGPETKHGYSSLQQSTMNNCNVGNVMDERITKSDKIAGENQGKKRMLNKQTSERLSNLTINAQPKKCIALGKTNTVLGSNSKLTTSVSSVNKVNVATDEKTDIHPHNVNTQNKSAKISTLNKCQDVENVTLISSEKHIGKNAKNTLVNENPLSSKQDANYTDQSIESNSMSSLSQTDSSKANCNNSEIFSKIKKSPIQSITLRSVRRRNDVESLLATSVGFGKTFAMNKKVNIDGRERSNSNASITSTSSHCSQSDNTRTQVDVKNKKLGAINKKAGVCGRERSNSNASITSTSSHHSQSEKTRMQVNVKRQKMGDKSACQSISKAALSKQQLGSKSNLSASGNLGKKLLERPRSVTNSTTSLCSQDEKKESTNSLKQPKPSTQNTWRSVTKSVLLNYTPTDSKRRAMLQTSKSHERSSKSHERSSEVEILNKHEMNVDTSNKGANTRSSIKKEKTVSSSHLKISPKPMSSNKDDQKQNKTTAKSLTDQKPAFYSSKTLPESIGLGGEPNNPLAESQTNRNSPDRQSTGSNCSSRGESIARSLDDRDSAKTKRSGIQKTSSVGPKVMLKTLKAPHSREALQNRRAFTSSKPLDPVAKPSISIGTINDRKTNLQTTSNKDKVQNRSAPKEGAMTKQARKVTSSCTDPIRPKQEKSSKIDQNTMRCIEPKENLLPNKNRLSVDNVVSNIDCKKKCFTASPVVFTKTCINENNEQLKSETTPFVSTEPISEMSANVPELSAICEVDCSSSSMYYSLHESDSNCSLSAKDNLAQNNENVFKSENMSVTESKCETIMKDDDDTFVPSSETSVSVGCLRNIPSIEHESRADHACIVKGNNFECKQEKNTKSPTKYFETCKLKYINDDCDHIGSKMEEIESLIEPLYPKYACYEQTGDCFMLYENTQPIPEMFYDRLNPLSVPDEKIQYCHSITCENPSTIQECLDSISSKPLNTVGNDFKVISSHTAKQDSLSSELSAPPKPDNELCAMNGKGDKRANILEELVPNVQSTVLNAETDSQKFVSDENCNVNSNTECPSDESDIIDNRRNVTTGSVTPCSLRRVNDDNITNGNDEMTIKNEIKSKIMENYLNEKMCRSEIFPVDCENNIVVNCAQIENVNQISQFKSTLNSDDIVTCHVLETKKSDADYTNLPDTTIDESIDGAYLKFSCDQTVCNVNKSELRPETITESAKTTDTTTSYAAINKVNMAHNSENLQERKNNTQSGISFSGKDCSKTPNSQVERPLGNEITEDSKSTNDGQIGQLVLRKLVQLQRKVHKRNSVSRGPQLTDEQARAFIEGDVIKCGLKRHKGTATLQKQTKKDHNSERGGNAPEIEPTITSEKKSDKSDPCEKTINVVNNITSGSIDETSATPFSGSIDTCVEPQSRDEPGPNLDDESSCSSSSTITDHERASIAQSTESPGKRKWFRGFDGRWRKISDAMEVNTSDDTLDNSLNSEEDNSLMSSDAEVLPIHVEKNNNIQPEDHNVAIGASIDKHQGDIECEYQNGGQTRVNSNNDCLPSNASGIADINNCLPLSNKSDKLSDMSTESRPCSWLEKEIFTRKIVEREDYSMIESENAMNEETTYIRHLDISDAIVHTERDILVTVNDQQASETLWTDNSHFSESYIDTNNVKIDNDVKIEKSKVHKPKMTRIVPLEHNNDGQRNINDVERVHVMPSKSDYLNMSKTMISQSGCNTDITSNDSTKTSERRMDNQNSGLQPHQRMKKWNGCSGLEQFINSKRTQKSIWRKSDSVLPQLVHDQYNATDNMNVIISKRYSEHWKRGDYTNFNAKDNLDIFIDEESINRNIETDDTVNKSTSDRLFFDQDYPKGVINPRVFPIVSETGFTDVDTEVPDEKMVERTWVHDLRALSELQSPEQRSEMLLVSFVEEDGRDEHINIASSSVHDRSIQFVVEKVTGPSGQSVTEDDGTLPSTSTRDKDSQDTSTMKDLQHQVRCLDHHQLAEFALSAIHDHPELERLLPSGNYPQTPEDTVPGWCHCGNCREMTLPEEQLCCRRRTGRCILLLAADVFQTSILNRVTLQIAVTNRNDLFVHADAASNDNLRHAAYRQYVLYKHGSLGKGNRVVIPSCVVWSIRNAYPSHNEIYTGFKPSRFN